MLLALSEALLSPTLKFHFTETYTDYFEESTYCTKTEGSATL